MSDDEKARRLEDLVQGHVEGRLAPEEERELLALLAADPAAGRFLLEQLDLSNLLAELHRGGDFAVETADRILASGAARRPRTLHRPALRPRAGWPAALAGAAVLLIAALFVALRPVRHPAETRPVPGKVQDSAPPIALPGPTLEPKPAPPPEPPPAPPRLDPERPPAPAPPAPPPAPAPERPLPQPPTPRRETAIAVATLVRVEGDAFLLSDESRIPAKEKDGVPEGRGLETAGARSLAVLEYLDGTRVQVQGETAIQGLSNGEKGKRLFLSRGSVRADIAAQPAGRPMVLATAHAEATVLGTSLVLRVDPDPKKGSTRLEVTQGKVRFKRLPDGASVDVSTGQFALAAPGTKLEVRPIPTAFEALALGLKPGAWGELETEDLLPALRSQGPNGTILVEAQGGVWDPRSEQFLYLGGDRGDTPRFVAYSARTNSWRVLPQPGWIAPGTLLQGEDHNALNPATGDFYHFPYGGGPRTVRRYNIEKKAWTDLPLLDPPEFLTLGAGVAWFPEMDGLFVANIQGGSAYLYREAAPRWITLSVKLRPGSYHAFAEYNPVHRVVLFGGGNAPGSRNLYRLDRTGRIWPLKDAPIDLGTNQALVTVDPVGGDFLVFGVNGSFHAYDVLQDRWTLRDERTPPYSDAGRVACVIASPVRPHGVVMFVKMQPGDPPRAWVYLYKHR